MDINMFSIPLTKYKVSRWEEKRNKLLEHVNSRDLTLGNETVWSDYCDGNPKEFISDILSDELEWFAHDYQCKPLIVETWYEVAYNGNYHPTHNHGHGGYSAVLFIKYDKTKHRPTNFVAPFDHFITGESLIYEPDVEEGDLILFPSFLHHYTHSHSSAERRIVLSFNLTIDKAHMPQSWTVNKPSHEVDTMLDYWL